MTETPALDVPRKDGVWEAPDNLRDSEGKPVSSQAGKNLMLVRVGIRKSAMKDASKFTLSQLRLVCGPQTGAASPAGRQGRGRVSRRVHRRRRPAGNQVPGRDHLGRSGQGHGRHG